MQLSLNKWGNSQGLRLSNKLLAQLGWTNADKFDVEITEDNKLMLSPIEGQDNGSLSFLFKDYEDDGIREEMVDFGERVGNEVW